MRIIIITLCIIMTCFAQDVKLASLVNNVKKSIIEMDSTTFSTCLSDKFFSYLDLDFAPEAVDSNYYTLLPSGYYGKELTQFVINKKNIIKFFSTENDSFPRTMCYVSEKSFSPLRKISENRYEIIIRRFYGEGFVHLVFIKFNNNWKLAGSFYKTFTEPCEEWEGNSWENN